MEKCAGRSKKNAGTETLGVKSGGKSDARFPNTPGPWSFGARCPLHFQQVTLRSHRTPVF